MAKSLVPVLPHIGQTTTARVSLPGGASNEWFSAGAEGTSDASADWTPRSLVWWPPPNRAPRSASVHLVGGNLVVVVVVVVVRLVRDRFDYDRLFFGRAGSRRAAKPPTDPFRGFEVEAAHISRVLELPGELTQRRRVAGPVRRTAVLEGAQVDDALVVDHVCAHYATTMFRTRERGQAQSIRESQLHRLHRHDVTYPSIDET